LRTQRHVGTDGRAHDPKVRQSALTGAVLQDLRLAIRSFLATPVGRAVAVLSLGLGIEGGALLLGPSAVVVASVQARHGADAPPLPQLLAQTGEYVRRFQREFATILGDEDYDQHVESRQYSTPSAIDADAAEHMPHSRRRRLHSEMLFLWLPAETAWLTVRNVLTVDGRPVPDSETRLNDALRDTSAERQPRLRRLRDESARFNLGSIRRNINYPTLALSYLDPAVQSRFKLTLDGRERINNVDAYKVGFDERSRPTIIQEDGADRVSRGVIWVADADGAVVRTRLQLHIPSSDTVVSVDVDYRRDARIDVWVPSRMRETYEHRFQSVVLERIRCVATYSNFRRFETSGRIVGPK
jgi:hypothetical protein